MTVRLGVHIASGRIGAGEELILRRASMLLKNYNFQENVKSLRRAVCADASLGGTLLYRLEFLGYSCVTHVFLDTSSDLHPVWVPKSLCTEK